MNIQWDREWEGETANLIVQPVGWCSLLGYGRVRLQVSAPKFSLIIYTKRNSFNCTLRGVHTRISSILMIRVLPWDARRPLFQFLCQWIFNNLYTVKLLEDTLIQDYQELQWLGHLSVIQTDPISTLWSNQNPKSGSTNTWEQIPVS